MIISRPRKSDAVLVSIGAIILLLLILGIFFVVRRQPEIPRQAPNAPGASAHSGPSAQGEAVIPGLSGFGRLNPGFAKMEFADTRQNT